MLIFLSHQCFGHRCGPFAADDSKSERRRKLEDMALAHSGWRFDGATCMLTFHFVPREERVPMAAEIWRRLKHGALVVFAHLSVTDGAGPGGDGGQGSAIGGCRAMPHFRWRQACRRSIRPGAGQGGCDWLCWRRRSMRLFYVSPDSAIGGCFIWRLYLGAGCAWCAENAERGARKLLIVVCLDGVI